MVAAARLVDIAPLTPCYHNATCWWTTSGLRQWPPSLKKSTKGLLNRKRIWNSVFLNYVNTLRPRQNGRRFPDDIFKYIFLNENVWISLKISLKFIPKVRINNIPASVQIMAWRWPGDKPLSETMMGNLLTHICVTRPQWDKFLCNRRPLTLNLC